MVGDPSGRSEERNLLDDDTLDHNVAAHQGAARAHRSTSTPGRAATLVDNRDWTSRSRLLEFLRDVGKHVTVNQMLARESVQDPARAASTASRSPSSATCCCRPTTTSGCTTTYGCELQIGGSDQWGNIIAGVDLIRRERRARRARPDAGRCSPPPTAPRSARPTGGAVWLDPASDHRRTSSASTGCRLDDAEVARVAADASRCARWTRSRQLARRARTGARAAARPAGPRRRDDRRSCTARTAARRRRRRPPTCCSAAIRRGAAPRPSRPSPARCRTRRLTQRATSATWSSCSSAHRPGALEQRRPAARSSSGAYRVNGAAIDADARPGRRRDLLHGRYLLLRKGKQHVPPRGDFSGRRLTLATRRSIVFHSALGAGTSCSTRAQAPTPSRSLAAAAGACPSFGSLKTEEKTERQCGQSSGRPSGRPADAVCQFRCRHTRRQQHGYRPSSHHVRCRYGQISKVASSARAFPARMVRSLTTRCRSDGRPRS